jgi:hypothetical protein
LGEIWNNNEQSPEVRIRNWTDGEGKGEEEQKEPSMCNHSTVKVNSYPGNVENRASS